MTRWLIGLLALVVATTASAGEIHFTALGAFVRSGVCAVDGTTSCSSNADCSSGACQLSAGCQKTRTLGTKFPVISMQCAATGIQESFWSFVTPPDMTASLVGQVSYHTVATSGSACFEVSVTIFDHNQGVNLLTTALDTTPVTLTQTVSLPANELDLVSASVTPFRRSNDGDGSGDCSASNCRSRYAVLRVARKNTGCAGNVSNPVFLDDVILTY